MTVGDIQSTAPGSGARYNAGKPAMELVPLRCIAESWPEPLDDGLTGALQSVALFQEGAGGEALHEAIRYLGNPWEDCARVFDYGRKKYSDWNWCRGMAWSIPIACFARHWLALARGEELDPESGLPHRGHLMCNIVMLLTYLRTYRDGDDRTKLLAVQGGVKVQGAPIVARPATEPAAPEAPWFSWAGGPFGPPLLSGRVVEFQTRDGKRGQRLAHLLRWTNICGGDDIVAYRYAFHGQ